MKFWPPPLFRHFLAAGSRGWGGRGKISGVLSRRRRNEAHFLLCLICLFQVLGAKHKHEFLVDHSLAHLAGSCGNFLCVVRLLYFFSPAFAVLLNWHLCLVPKIPEWKKKKKDLPSTHHSCTYNIKHTTSIIHELQKGCRGFEAYMGKNNLSHKGFGIKVRFPFFFFFTLNAPTGPILSYVQLCKGQAPKPLYKFNSSAQLF